MVGTESQMESLKVINGSGNPSGVKEGDVGLRNEVENRHEIQTDKSQAKMEGCTNGSCEGTNNCTENETTDLEMKKLENGNSDSGSHSQKAVASCDTVGASDNSNHKVVEKMEQPVGKKVNTETSTSMQKGNDTGDSPTIEGGSNTEGDTQKKNATDPYAYVNRADFTSEKFKIEIRGLPKFYGYGELKKFLNDKLKLSSHKVKPTRNKSPWVFVCFKNEQDRQAALKTLNRLTWKGRMLTAVTAKPAPDPLVKKRKLQHETGLSQENKKPRINDDEKLRNSTTPYWNLSYDEQLKKKYDYVMKIMCKLADQIITVNPMLTQWIRAQKAKYNGMACNMLDIRKSPTCDGYRNKCEFTIGINEETKQRMVGFRLGSYVQGHVGVGPIDSLKHIPQRMKDTVKVFEGFIRASAREPFNPETHTGHWRQLTLRLTTLDELMVVVVTNSKGASIEDLAVAKEEVRAFFEEGEGKDLKVNSLYFQAFGKREAGKEPPPMEHVLGAKHITECIFGLKFRISPEAFFQVNTPGAGVLYSTVGELMDLNSSTTIVDICCGTGTIGLSLAKDCGQVLGLEVVAPAIDDAKVNAAENNITNCEFFTGRAEEILSSVLSRAKGKSVYAIVDPPRSGLQQKAVIALRGAEVVDQVVYVSCDPNAALKNFVDLARQTSKSFHGYPLVPVTAIPVDMFPHTAHCEVVILFHRVNPNNLPKPIPVGVNDIAVLSETLVKKSSEESQPPPDSEKDGDNPDTKNEMENSEHVSGMEPNKNTCNQLDMTDKKLKVRRKRPGRNQRELARKLLGMDPTVARNQTISGARVSSGPTLTPKSATTGRAEGKNRNFIAGSIGKLILKDAFKRSTPEDKDFHFARNSKTFDRGMRGRPLGGCPGDRRVWRDGWQSFQGPNIHHGVEPWPQSGEKGLLMEEHGSHSRRSGMKDEERRERGREWSRRSPPPMGFREGMVRGTVEEDVWGRSEEEKQWGRRGGRSPPEEGRRNLIGEAEKLVLLKGPTHGGVGRYSPVEMNFREGWTSRGNIQPLHCNMRDGEGRQGRRDFQEREEEIRFRMDSDRRSPINEHGIDPWNERRRRRESLSPGRRFESNEFDRSVVGQRRAGNDQWYPSSGPMRHENDRERLSYRKRKYSDSGEDCDRPKFDEFGEGNVRRPFERSPERFSRSPERFERRSCERFERSNEGFDRRSCERFDRASHERRDRRSFERFDRSCEEMERPERQNLLNDYCGNRRGSIEGENLIGQRPKLFQERENIVPKYLQREDQQLNRNEQYNEPETLLSTRYRENRSNSDVNERAFLAGSSPSRVAHHRRDDVGIIRGPNDVPLPHSMDLERRIPVSHPNSEERNHYGKRYDPSILGSNYPAGEGIRGHNEHDVVVRRVEVIRRPFVMDDKYGVLLDASGKPLGPGEVLLVTAKNQTYDGDHKDPFRPVEDGPSRMILPQRGMEVMPKTWNVENQPSSHYLKSTSPVRKFDNQSEVLVGGRGLASRPQEMWVMDRHGGKEMPLAWGDPPLGKTHFTREQPGMSDGSASSFTSHQQGIDKRPLHAPLHSAVTPNAPQNGDRSFSHPMAQAGYGPKVFTLEPNRQVPGNVNFANKIPDHSRLNQNVPFNVMTPNSGPAGAVDHLNNKALRPPMFSQNAPSLMNLRATAPQQLPSLVPNQSLPRSDYTSGTSVRQRMPTGILNSVSEPKPGCAPWNFKGISPWGQRRQELPFQRSTPQNHCS